MDFWLFLQVSVHPSLSLSLWLTHTPARTHTHTHLHALLCVYRWAVELTPTHTEVRSQEGSWHICARNENCILIILQKRFFCFGPKKTGGDETGDETKRNETEKILRNSRFRCKWSLRASVVWAGASGMKLWTPDSHEDNFSDFNYNFLIKSAR